MHLTQDYVQDNNILINSKTITKKGRMNSSVSKSSKKINHIKHLDTLIWRCIGPPRGGRVVAVSGDPKESQVFYFGAVAGGIWKTKDGGTYWENVSDGFLKSASVGALTVAPSDGNVIYAGMGESTIRIDVSYGDGVYKSKDAGKTWKKDRKTPIIPFNHEIEICGSQAILKVAANTVYYAIAHDQNGDGYFRRPTVNAVSEIER